MISWRWSLPRISYSSKARRACSLRARLVKEFGKGGEWEKVTAATLIHGP
jgi:hypothetical protein